METLDRINKQSNLQQESFKQKLLGSHIKDINATWKLTFEVTNSQGTKAFGGYNVSPYPDPMTGNTIMLRGLNNRMLNGYFIESPVIMLRPQEKNQHGIKDQNIIAFLLASPEVRVEGFNGLPEVYKNNKMSNPKITLTNMDYRETSKIDYENEVDKIVGKLSADVGKNAIGFETLRNIAAYVGLPFTDARYTSNKAAMAKILRDRLKKYVRVQFEHIKDGKTTNLDKVKEAIEKVEDAKLAFCIKSLIRENVIESKPGGYMYFHNQLIGQNIAVVIDRAKQDAELADSIDIEMNKLIKDKKI